MMPSMYSGYSSVKALGISFKHFKILDSCSCCCKWKTRALLISPSIFFSVRGQSPLAEKMNFPFSALQLIMTRTVESASEVFKLKATAGFWLSWIRNIFAVSELMLSGKILLPIMALMKVDLPELYVPTRQILISFWLNFSLLASNSCFLIKKDF